jgi:hypothetical protein
MRHAAWRALVLIVAAGIPRAAASVAPQARPVALVAATDAYTAVPLWPHLRLGSPAEPLAWPLVVDAALGLGRVHNVSVTLVGLAHHAAHAVRARLYAPAAEAPLARGPAGLGGRFLAFGENTSTVPWGATVTLVDGGAHAALPHLSAYARGSPVPSGATWAADGDVSAALSGSPASGAWLLSVSADDGAGSLAGWRLHVCADNGTRCADVDAAVTAEVTHLPRHGTLFVARACADARPDAVPAPAALGLPPTPPQCLEPLHAAPSEWPAPELDAASDAGPPPARLALLEHGASQLHAFYRPLPDTTPGVDDAFVFRVWLGSSPSPPVRAALSLRTCRPRATVPLCWDERVAAGGHPRRDASFARVAAAL